MTYADGTLHVFCVSFDLRGMGVVVGVGAAGGGGVEIGRAAGGHGEILCTLWVYQLIHLLNRGEEWEEEEEKEGKDLPTLSDENWRMRSATS